jgi:hypothetical protein
MADNTTTFTGTEWLKLETAIEIIGDLIALRSSERYQAIENNQPASTIASLTKEIHQLGIERQTCYDTSTNHEIITKAFSVYAPLLKEQN